MKAVIYISGRIKGNETLKDVIRQYKSFDAPSEVLAIIDSVGGDKYEGDAVHDYFKALEASGIPVTTKAIKAYSIAAKIFASGGTRIVTNEPNVLGIHFASITPAGSFSAEQMQELTKKMFGFKTEFTNFYADHLNIDKGTVENLLKNETVMSGSEAVELGFATQLEDNQNVTAELTFNNLNMTEKKKSKGQILVEAMADFVGLNKDEPEVTAELVLQDSTGEEITFPGLESDGVPKVGDAATFGGKAIEDGKTFIMPQLEDATVLFMGGKIESITPKEEEKPEGETEAEEPTAEAKAAELVEANLLAIQAAKDEVTAEMNVTIEAQKKEIFELNKKITSPEIKAEIKEVQTIKVDSGLSKGAARAQSILAKRK